MPAPIIFPLLGFHNLKTIGVQPLMEPLSVPPPYLKISGLTLDAAGAALAGCTVDLYRTATRTFVASVISGADGSYEFRSGALSTEYYVVAYKAGAPDVFATSVNTLTAA